MSYFSTGAELQAAIAALPASKIGSYVPFDVAFYSATYMADYQGDLAPYDHFVQIGAPKLNKPNAQFDPVFYANDNADLKALVNSGQINAADLLFHYLQYGLDEGRVATAELDEGFDPAVYLAANPDVKTAIEAAIAADPTAFGGNVNNGAVAHYVKFGMAEDRPGGIDDGGTVTETELDIGRDNIVGTAGDDMFNAYIFDNKNTLESGDRVNGGAGDDTLFADIGDSQAFSITPHLTSVENVKIRVQTTEGDDSDNNMTDGTQIDAERSVGVTHWESNNSRADLKIEDVRIQDDEITKDITIAMVATDPGNVDYAVYFDQPSLRKEGNTSTTQLTVSISNPLETSKGFDAARPLLDVPYDQLRFLLDGEEKTIELDLTGVETYDDLFAALQAAFAAAAEDDASLAGISITRIPNGESFFSRDGEPRTADQFVLAAQDAELTRATVGWNASGGLPSDNAFSAIVTQGAPISESFLITSTVILDHVGRGSMGGDLVIGGLSVGDTSTSRGVEQFDITVERSSKLQQIGSTNDTLEVVTITSGAQYREVVNGSFTDLKYGDLTVTGDVTEDPYNEVIPGEKPNLPGSQGNQSIDGLYGDGNGFGFTNVREIDASGFLGNTNMNLLLDHTVVGKYMDLFDTAADPAADNIEFSYKLGTKNDNFFLAISEINLSNAGTTTREDFDLLIEGGAGDDVIDALVGEDDGSDGDLASSGGGTSHWYLNSALNANLAIDAGAGNDTVATHGSGDWYVDLSAGDDTYYADNSGDKSAWVFNAVNLGGGVDLDNIRSDANDVYAIFKGQLTVSLTREDGSVYTTDVVTVPSTTSATSDLQVNQAIKEAINSDPVLSKLLLAYDGPANSLVVVSRIDEQSGGTASGLSVDIAAPAAGSLTAAEVSAYALKHGLGVGATAAQVVASINAAIIDWEVEQDYVPDVAEAGSNSSHTADNTIIGATGDDVLVLGTGTESNDTVVYQGFGNGYDTIVNFNTEVNELVPTVVITGAAATAESFTVSFADLELTAPNAQSTLTFDGVVVDLGTATDSLIPGEDVAYQVFLATGGVTPNWTLDYVEGTNEVTFTANVLGDVDPDITTADFVFNPNVENDNPVAISDYVDGRDAFVAAAAEVFEVDFNGTVVVDDGSFTFDGVTINYVVGDGPIELAAKIAAANFPNWTVTNDLTGTVTFTADETGEFDPDVTPETFDDVTVAAGVAEVFTATFPAFGPSAAGGETVSFNGATYTTAAGDTEVEIAAGLAAAVNGTAAASWTGAAVGATITFTNENAGAVADVTSAAFTVTGGITAPAVGVTTQGVTEVTETGIVASVLVTTQGADQQGELESSEIVNLLRGQGDYLDFSSYDADGVVVDGGTLVGSAGSADTYVRMTQDTAAFPGEGVYLIELVNADGNSTTNDVQVIGVADFGRDMDFVADNFIL